MNGRSAIPLLTKSARCFLLVCLILNSASGRAFAQQALTLSPSQMTVQAGEAGTPPVNIHGGTKPYTFAFSNGNARAVQNAPGSLIVRALKPGESILTVKDAKGQTATMKVTVSAPPPLKVNPAELTVKPGGQSQISADQKGTFSISGGLQPYTYAFSSDVARMMFFGKDRLEFYGVKPGVAVVTFKDAVGQSATAKIIVEGAPLAIDPVALTVMATADKTLLIHGAKPFSFTQSNDNAQISQAGPGLHVRGVKPGKTIVTVTDAFGKTATATVTIEPPLGFKPEAPITVISPRAGDSWTEGSSQTITWTYKGMPPGPDAKLFLSTAESAVPVFVENITMKTPMGSAGSGGSFVWRLPNVRAATNYVVTVLSTQNEGFRGKSGKFTIVPPKPPTPLATALSENFVLTFGGQAAAGVSGGKPPYAVRSENPAIATASVEPGGSGVSLISKAKGTVRIIITDSGGQQLVRTIVVR